MAAASWMCCASKVGRPTPQPAPAVPRGASERHSPWLPDHAHGNQRSKAKLSHSAQARMSTLYTHIGNEITVAAGSGPVLRSANQLRELLHEPFPTTCMSGVPRRPDGTVTTMVASAATDS